MEEFENSAEKIRAGREKLKAALAEVSFKSIDGLAENGGEPEFGTHCKRKINRIFREEAGKKEIPYPEADTVFERLRSFMIRKIT